MADSTLRTIEIHYDLFKSHSHSMNALAYNRAEYNFILAIQSLRKFLDCGIKVDIEAREEGSIIDNLKVFTENSVLTNAFNTLIGALIGYWFRPRLSKTEEIKNKIEIAEKIKEGNFTQQEAEALLENDKQLRKWCSLYYKHIEGTGEVSQITANVVSGDHTIEQESICHTDFVNKIITVEEFTETRTIEGVTIHIVSPVLSKVNKKLVWRGIYSNKPIDFKIEDREFLDQVYNNEIKFGNSTYIKCSLTINTLTKTNDEGEEKVDNTYIVKDVTQWADGESFQNYTKRYKRSQKERNTPRPQSLFSEEDFLELI